MHACIITRLHTYIIHLSHYFCVDPLLPHLEMLLVSQRTEEHRPLLRFCFHHIHSSQSEDSDDEYMDAEDSQHQGQNEPIVLPLNQELEERRRKAMEKREQVMNQMSNLQKAFLEKHKDELEEIDYSAESDKYVPKYTYLLKLIVYKACILTSRI